MSVIFFVLGLVMTANGFLLSFLELPPDFLSSSFSTQTASLSLFVVGSVIQALAVFWLREDSQTLKELRSIGKIISP